jgi:dipeptidyl aminopeptidase/acylaminoacyl peptidase
MTRENHSKVKPVWNRLSPLIISLYLLVVTPVLYAAEDTYTLPPESVQELFSRDKNYATLDAMSPDGEHFLVPLSTELSTLEEMSKETYRLAGLELRPKTNREWRLDTFGIYGLRIYSFESRQFRDVQIPAKTLVSDMMWSADGRRVAFLAHRPEGTRVWTADVTTGSAAPLNDAFVMATLTGRPSRGPVTGSSRMLQWTPDGTLITLLVPSNRGPEPKRGIPKSPTIRTTREKPAPTRTQPFLLKDDHDVALFRYYATAQMAELSPGKAPRKIGDPAIYMGFSSSPDGKYVLAEKLVEPFSFIVGYPDFPNRLEVMDLDGKILSTIREIPLQEDQTRSSAQVLEDFPREVAWRPTGSTLGFLWKEEKEKAAESDESNDESPRHDRIMSLAAPFDMSQAKLHVLNQDTDQSFSNVRYAMEGGYAFVTVRDSDNENGESTEKIVAYDLSRDEPTEQIIVPDYDPEDILQHPGEILTQRTGNGILYAFTSSDGRQVYLQGDGFKQDFRPQPFVDRVAIGSGENERVFEGSKDVYERPLVPLDRDVSRMIVSRESMTVFPDSYLWSPSGSVDKLTANQDPFPEITGVKRVDFTFTRRDGLEIHGRISLPVGYQDGTRVPAIFWTYPSEYSSKEDYQKDAIRDRNRNAFTHLSYLRWSDIWLSQGYALVHPDVPIIDKGNTYNDNYIQHMVDSLYAAIRKVDQMGYVDIDRIGHGGHSYGAFATANLLAHTPFFKAGIAGDGAYNRSLTPMGFQRERRFLWDTHGLYLEMSPFFQADHIDTPILLYHGADDDNTGTFPIQSDRMIQALTGLGKTAVLYKYPFESHSPRAKETYLDLWARWLEWFDKYVKNPPKHETN